MAVRPFYWARSIERVHIGLLDMFDNIVIRRRYGNNYPPNAMLDENGRYKLIPVPLYTHFSQSYANWVYTTQNTPQQGKSFSPSIGLRFQGLGRNLSEQPPPTRNRHTYNRKNSTYIRDLQPVAYIFRYELSIYTEIFEDTQQILENILPYYVTTRSVRLKEWLRQSIDDIERDIIIELGDPSIQFNEENTLGQKRHIISTIPITAKGFLYKQPTEAAVIESIQYTNYINYAKDYESTSRGYMPYSALGPEYSGIDGYSGIDYQSIPMSASVSDSSVVPGAIIINSITDDNGDTGWSTYEFRVDSSMGNSFYVDIPQGSIIVSTLIRILLEYNSADSSVGIAIAPTSDLDTLATLQDASNLYPTFSIRNTEQYIVNEDSRVFILFNQGASTMGLAQGAITWMSRG